MIGTIVSALPLPLPAAAATAVPTHALAHQTHADEAAAGVMAGTLFAILSISGGIAIAGALS